MTEKSLFAQLFHQARRLSLGKTLAAAKHEKLADHLKAHGRRRFGRRFGDGDDKPQSSLCPFCGVDLNGKSFWDCPECDWGNM